MFTKEDIKKKIDKVEVLRKEMNSLVFDDSRKEDREEEDWGSINETLGHYNGQLEVLQMIYDQM